MQACSITYAACHAIAVLLVVTQPTAGRLNGDCSNPHPAFTRPSTRYASNPPMGHQPCSPSYRNPYPTQQPSANSRPHRTRAAVFPLDALPLSACCVPSPWVAPKMYSAPLLASGQGLSSLPLAPPAILRLRLEKKKKITTARTLFSIYTTTVGHRAAFETISILLTSTSRLSPSSHSPHLRPGTPGPDGERAPNPRCIQDHNRQILATTLLRPRQWRYARSSVCVPACFPHPTKMLLFRLRDSHKSAFYK
ncbi:hypothetical protein GQ44DRAFT_208576 [Phaeosphaeriaceae sp. PMI808]|nr:hypothetical protein GQ44DRAFT_208576 [Phaeosphaeriaceae sp. PMI808]